MVHSIETGSKGPASWGIAFAFAVLLLTGSAEPAYAEGPVTTMATLLDRVQIEDLLNDYYAYLGGGHRGFGSFYTEDGVLDVNGIIARGRASIDELYAKIEQPGLGPRGTFHMLVTNPRIAVHGSAATADVIWTGIICDAVTGPPRFVEQGREHDELVKANGRWYFKHRVITSDAGLTAMFFKTYRQR